MSAKRLKLTIGAVLVIIFWVAVLHYEFDLGVLPLTGLGILVSLVFIGVEVINKLEAVRIEIIDSRLELGQIRNTLSGIEYAVKDASKRRSN